MTQRDKPKILFIKSGTTFPLDLMLAFKAKCNRQDKSMTDVLSDLVKQWVKEKHE